MSLYIIFEKSFALYFLKHWLAYANLKEDNMNTITVKIGGMMCGMCEAHICDTIRRAFPGAKKVSASRKNGEATFLYDGEIDEEKLKKAISDTGYTFVSVSTGEYKKKGLFGR